MQNIQNKPKVPLHLCMKVASLCQEWKSLT